MAIQLQVRSQVPSPWTPCYTSCLSPFCLRFIVDCSNFVSSSDTYAQDSIDMLSNSAGIDFSRIMDNGIEQTEFGELLITSGLVLLEEVTWITFTGYPSQLPPSLPPSPPSIFSQSHPATGATI